MRDTLELRNRLVMLAALSAAAMVPACTPPPTPQPVADDEGSRSTNATPQPRGVLAREKYYRAQAKEQGKTFEEVAPPRLLKALARRDRRTQRAEPGEATQADPRRSATPQRRAYYAEKAEKAEKAASAAAKAPEGAAAEAPEGAAAKFDRFAPIDGDPPFIEGYNPEEDACTSGNWCAPLSAATQVAVPKVPTHAIGCPERITGGRAQGDPFPEGKVFASLSSSGAMQGTLNAHGTELKRERGAADDTCCYHWFEYCSGRPHLADDGPLLAPTRPGRAWSPDTCSRPQEPLAGLPARVAARLAAAWISDAQMEHASVAAFSRAMLELMAVGAPAELVRGCQQAAGDEIGHAEQCFALATRYGAPPQQPGPLPLVSPRAGGLPQLAGDTFAEGCVGETIAALVVERAAQRCTDPEVRRVLTQIAADEARHAALAWRTVAWAMARDAETPASDDALATALRTAAAAARPPSHVPRPDTDADADVMARCGRLDAAGLWQAQRDAWRDIIDPMLAQLLGEAAAAPSPAQS